MKLPEFKIRASGAGAIMTNPRSKSETLGKTCITYLETWVKEQIYNRRKEVTTKYMEKGLIAEDNSLDLVAKNMGVALLLKNEKHFEDDFMTGTPDAILKDCVIDVKSSWDTFTFPLFAKKIPEKAYYLQLQCYMALTKKKRSKLVYTLIDTPAHLIQKEAYWYSRDNGYGELTEEMLAEFTKRMTYKDVPENLKYKSFDIVRNDADIQLIKDRVIECREYIKTLTFK